MAKRNYRSKSPKIQAPVSVMRADVDVVIPVYGRRELLEKCLESLPKAMGSLSYHILLIDNNSPDRPEMLEFFRLAKTKYSNLTIFLLDQNRGFPTACNFGASRGRSPFVAFVNTDITMEPGSFEILVEDMVDQTVIVGPKLLFPENTPHGPAGRIQHAGLDMNIRGEIQHTFIGWDANNAKANIKCSPFALTGAVMLVRRKFFKDAGGFFEGYGLGTWEDVDLCATARKMGYNILYEPDAVGFHWVGASATKYNVAYPMNQNRQIFLTRHQDNIYWSEWERL